METRRAIEIIQRLADGVNPYTGEIMENGSVFQNPETVRALYTALELLKYQESRKERQRSAPGNKEMPGQLRKMPGCSTSMKGEWISLPSQKRMKEHPGRFNHGY